MKTCPTCGHDRLMHDSWGCKTKCGCGVGIIYLTPNLFSEEPNRAKEQEVLDEGKKLDVESDRLAESMVRQMRERSLEEVAPHPPPS